MSATVFQLYLVSLVLQQIISHACTGGVCLSQPGMHGGICFFLARHARVVCAFLSQACIGGMCCFLAMHAWVVYAFLSHAWVVYAFFSQACKGGMCLSQPGMHGWYVLFLAMHAWVVLSSIPARIQELRLGGHLTNKLQNNLITL